MFGGFGGASFGPPQGYSAQLSPAHMQQQQQQQQQGAPPQYGHQRSPYADQGYVDDGYAYEEEADGPELSA